MVSLDRPLQRPAQGLEKAAADEGGDLVAVRNHGRANNPTLAQTALDVGGGDVVAIIDLPEDLAPGKHHVTAYLVGADGAKDGLGAVAVKVVAKEQ